VRTFVQRSTPVERIRVSEKIRILFTSHEQVRKSVDRLGAEEESVRVARSKPRTQARGQFGARGFGVCDLVLPAARARVAAEIGEPFKKGRFAGAVFP